MNSFINYYATGYTTPYLLGFFQFDQTMFTTFYNSFGTLPPYVDANDAVNQLITNIPTLSADLTNFIIMNGGCGLHYNILTNAFSIVDLTNSVSGWSSVIAAIDNAYSTSNILDALYTFKFTHVWDVLYFNVPPIAPATHHVDWFFTNQLTATYEKALLHNYTQVAKVQTANYYYSKTQYFQYIKDEYGQYTYDVLVGKFIHLSNQFKDMFALTEWHMYGSSRLGVHKPMSPFGGGAGGGRELVHIEFEGTWNQYTQSVDDTSNTTTTTYQMSYDYFTLTRGEKNYEMVNHLGNVLVIISDKKLKTCEGDTVNYYMADVLQAMDYSAFGVILKDREYYANSSNKYRYSYNGMERDDEVKGVGNSYDYKERIYDPRLGRFLSVDKLTSSFPFYSPYQFAGNMPIIAIDLDGLEPKYMITEQGRLTKPMITLLNSAFGYNVKRMEKTKWKEVSFDFGAITLYKTVRYDHAYTDDTDDEWARTIVHEQKHRNEVGNFIGRALGWYIGYGFDYLFAGFNYMKINAEERAYGMEPKMDALMAFDGGIAMKILENDKFGDADKSAALRYVGLSYKLDVAQNKLTSLKTQLENYNGNDRGKRRLEKRIARQESAVNSAQTATNAAKTEQVDKVINEVKKKP